MAFWYGLILFVLGCNIANDFIEKKALKHIIFFIFFIFLWAIAAFRVDIGYDYWNYVRIFSWTGGIDEWISNLGTAQILTIEPMFALITGILKDAGINALGLFFVYSTVMMFFIWRGLNYYLGKSYAMWIFALSIFFFNRDLYFDFFSIIRQGTAVALCFWGSKYIISREMKKYLFWVLFAATWHYSALLMIFPYFICTRKISSVILLGLPGISLLLSILGIMPRILEWGLNFFGIYAVYLDRIEVNTALWGTMVIFFLFIILAMLFRVNNDKERMLLNMVFLCSLFIGIGFTLDVMLRVSYYFEIFYIALIPLLFSKLPHYNIIRYILLVPFIILFIFNLYGLQRQSYEAPGVNIEYDYSFDFFD